MMYFSPYMSADQVLQHIKPKLEVVIKNCHYQYSIDIKNCKKKRTIDQNSYMWAIFDHIVKFNHATGFIPDSLNLNFITADFLHEYFKARFDVKQTKDMDYDTHWDFCQQIQQLMIEQTKGEYDPIYPPENPNFIA